jgi:hypothetical protein
MKDLQECLKILGKIRFGPRLGTYAMSGLGAWLLLAPVRGHCLTTNSDGSVTYSAFDSTVYVLQPWFGRNVALLTPTNQTLGTNVMGPILVALDAAWDYYRSVTPAALSPVALSSTTLYGRDTIAVVNSTCGAGCSYVGYTGTEMLPAYFNTLYNGYVSSHQFDQVLFYEFGRNWWFYDGQLKYQAPDVDPTVTGFAVYMRFASMDGAGVAGGPYNGVSFLTFRNAVTHLMDSYIVNSSLNWSNTFRISQAPANSLGLSGTDLFASLVMRIGRDFGDQTFNQNIWKQVSMRTMASSTQMAVDNFALAACATVSQNLTGIFTNTWKFPLSTNAIQEALQRWGPQIVLHPRLSFILDQGGNLVIRWQTEVNTSYQVQSSSDLQTWSDLGSVLAGNGTVQSVANPISASTNAFFRLKVN